MDENLNLVIPARRRNSFLVQTLPNLPKRRASVVVRQTVDEVLERPLNRAELEEIAKEAERMEKERSYKFVQHWPTVGHGGQWYNDVLKMRKKSLKTNSRDTFLENRLRHRSVFGGKLPYISDTSIDNQSRAPLLSSIDESQATKRRLITPNCTEDTPSDLSDSNLEVKIGSFLKKVSSSQNKETTMEDVLSGAEARRKKSKNSYVYSTKNDRLNSWSRSSTRQTMRCAISRRSSNTTISNDTADVNYYVLPPMVLPPIYTVRRGGFGGSNLNE